MIEKLKEIWQYKEESRVATIFFEMFDGKRRFLECKFDVEGRKSYNLKDWEFLKNVAEEIIRLTEIE